MNRQEYLEKCARDVQQRMAVVAAEAAQRAGVIDWDIASQRAGWRAAIKRICRERILVRIGRGRYVLDDGGIGNASAS